jgi:hypothetical protein
MIFASDDPAVRPYRTGVESAGLRKSFSYLAAAAFRSFTATLANTLLIVIGLHYPLGKPSKQNGSFRIDSGKNAREANRDTRSMRLLLFGARETKRIFRGNVTELLR